MRKPEVIISSQRGVTTLTSSIEINRPRTLVWQVLSLPGQVDKFHPLIKKSYMTTAEQNGKGAKRTCELLPMGRMDEVITSWDEGNSFTIEVTGGRMLPPHHFMKGHFEISDSGENTIVTFTFSYQLKFGLLGRLMDSLFIRPQFKGAPPKYVKGLKEYVESNANANS